MPALDVLPPVRLHTCARRLRVFCSARPTTVLLPDGSPLASSDTSPLLLVDARVGSTSPAALGLLTSADRERSSVLLLTFSRQTSPAPAALLALTGPLSAKRLGGPFAPAGRSHDVVERVQVSRFAALSVLPTSASTLPRSPVGVNPLTAPATGMLSSAQPPASVFTDGMLIVYWHAAAR